MSTPTLTHTRVNQDVTQSIIKPHALIKKEKRKKKEQITSSLQSKRSLMNDQNEKRKKSLEKKWAKKWAANSSPVLIFFTSPNFLTHN